MTRISIPLGKDHKDAIRRSRQDRDTCATQLGILLHDYEHAKSALIQRIDRSNSVEQALMESLIREHGHDPDEGDWRAEEDHIVQGGV
jgi:hypothetical protein